ncbi:MAG: hypothetical protein OSJ63_04175 [Bacilli bacterium]|nr:hypothetical protein [Bacilli bacterium]
MFKEKNVNNYESGGKLENVPRETFLSCIVNTKNKKLKFLK